MINSEYVISDKDQLFTITFCVDYTEKVGNDPTSFAAYIATQLDQECNSTGRFIDVTVSPGKC